MWAHRDPLFPGWPAKLEVEGAESLCPYVSETVDCTVSSLYQCNKRFKGVTPSDQIAFQTLDFSRFHFCNLETSARKLYFGPHFLHRGVVFGHSSHNYSMMMRRQFALRVDNEDYDHWLRGSQDNVRTVSGFDEWMKIVKERIEELSPDEDIQDLLYEYAHRPHEKRLIRVRAYESLRDSGRLEDFSAYCTGVTYKLKIPEFGDPDKLPRVIGDFGTEGSILGGFVLEYAKKAFVEPIEVNGLTLVFVPCPSTTALRAVFRDLVYNTNNVFYFFSDDSCLAFTLKCGRRVMLNVDISKCDGSIGDPIFEIGRELLSTPGMAPLVDAVIAQCKLPCTLRDPEYRKILKVVPIHHSLSSGTVLTTFLDNIGSSTIALSINEYIPMLSDDANDEEIQAMVSTAASFVGFLVTCEICPTYHHLQFLKHSPCEGVDGLLHPVLNLGVVLRAIGQKDGEFVYKSHEDLIRKCEQHNSGVVKGFVHMGNHTFHDVLATRFCSASAPIFKSYITRLTHDQDATPSPRITDDELMTRYAGDRQAEILTDYDELLSHITHSNFGDGVSCAASRCILKRDYGL